MNLPAPLVPPEVDCTDLDGFMLNVERLQGSELVALSTHEVLGAALLLWSRAWKQRPAASLPDDDRVLAAFARLTPARWKKIRAEVLRGFVKCSDGRFYHAVLAEEAIRAFERKTAFRAKREKEAQRLANWRKKKSGHQGDLLEDAEDETRFETRGEARFVQEGQGQGQGQGRSPPYSTPPGGERVSEGEEEKAPARKRGTQLPASFTADQLQPSVQPVVAAWPPGMLEREFDRFVDWTRSEGTVSKDWKARWANWIRKADDDLSRAATRTNGRPSGWGYATSR